jgi:hypothetical protein
MTDIFVSYRRGDGERARRIALDLGERFDVFVDADREALDFGDSFPDRITQALDECSVCLAVIGPAWLSDENIARLADPNDWVRREIAQAIASKRVRTVPVLVGNAVLPDSARLPAMLQPLLARNAAKLTPDNWETDFAQLAARAETWLVGGQVPVASARRSIPAVLPYLCDRVEQQDALVDLIGAGSGGQQAYVCILHGHKWEFHGSFLDRLRHRRVLENLFDARDGIAVCALQWNREKAKAGQYADVLSRALKADAMQRPAATQAELLVHLRKLAQPLVAVMQVTWSDLERCGGALVDGLVGAWRSLFADAAKTDSSSGMPAVLWINVTYDDDTQALAVPDVAGLLPRLAPVTQDNVSEWLAIDEVKRAVTGFEPKLFALADDESICIERGKMHMLNFVDGVRRILAGA